MAAPDARPGYLSGDRVDTSARRLFAITPSDSVDLTYLTKAVQVGGAGTIAIQAADDSAAVTLTVAAGAILPVRATRVFSTGTTATLIVGLA